MADHEKSYIPIYVSFGGNDKETILAAIEKLVHEAYEYGSPLYINWFVGAPSQPPSKPPGGG